MSKLTKAPRERTIADDVRPLMLIPLGVMLGLGFVGGFVFALAVLR